MIKPILQYPGPILNQPSKDVVDFDDGLLTLFQDMRDTLKASDGVGLSAVQIGIPLKACIIKTGKDTFLDVCNPVISDTSGVLYMRTGCLSMPGLEVPIRTPEDLTLSFQGLDGSDRSVALEGLLARIACHEIDHGCGKLIIDHVSEFKRSETLKKWRRR